VKLVSNKLCRKRYKVQIKLRKWVNGGGWGWDVGKVNPKKKKPQSKGNV